METLPENVVLSDGRTAEKKENIKVRDIAQASNQPKGKEYLVPYATIAAKTIIDKKNVVLEDILDLSEDDFLLITTLFVSEDDLKNA